MIYKYVTEKFSHFNLADEEIFALIGILKFRRYKRKETIFYIGERVNTIAMLVEGAAYSTMLHDDGKERITSLHYPDSLSEIVFNYEDYLQGSPSQKNYLVYEESLLLLLDINAVRRLYEQFPRFYQLELMLMQPNLLLALKSIHILQGHTSNEKIRLLKQHFPKIFQLFPYSYIASYLGVHRNTFNKVMASL